MLVATRRRYRPHATELLFRAEASVLEAEFELFQLRHAQQIFAVDLLYERADIREADSSDLERLDDDRSNAYNTVRRFARLCVVLFVQVKPQSKRSLLIDNDVICAGVD